jgi:hypothetical protein
MLFALGFLAASLIALMSLPSIHNRAVRLTKRRCETQMPLSMTEILADKDLLRAQFAKSTRCLEVSLEQVKTKAAGQLAELGRKSAAISRLKAELAEKTAAIAELISREKTLQDQLRASEDEFFVKSQLLRQSECTFSLVSTQASGLSTRAREIKPPCRDEAIVPIAPRGGGRAA